MSAERQIVSLKQISNDIQKTIANRYKLAYWVRAEIHKLNKYPSGGSYPELVQKQDGSVVAQMRGQIWKSTFESIEKKFVEQTKEKLQDGMEVLLFAKIVYSDKGGISLNILDIDPQFTLGALQKERQETWKKLGGLGLLKQNQNLSIPKLPKRIAIISGASSKGLNDFMEVLYKYPKYGFLTHLFPATLQGDKASMSIRKALKRIHERRMCFDAVIIVRGGGEEVGMSCYNDFELCREIAQFGLPILTGIGHSTNLTVAEMIAYDNGITPTALAQWFIDRMVIADLELTKQIDLCKSMILNMLDKSNIQIQSSVLLMEKELLARLSTEKRELRFLNEKLQSRCVTQMERKNALLNQISEQVRRELSHRIRMEKNVLGQQQKQLKSLSFMNVHEQTVNLKGLNSSVCRHAPKQIMRNDEQLRFIRQRVHALDPIHVLRRGFSITRVQGKAVHPSEPLNKGLEIETEWVGGKITSRIEDIKPKDE